MDLRFPTGLLNNLLPEVNKTQNADGVTAPKNNSQPPAVNADTVSLSTQNQQSQTSRNEQGGLASKQPRLISETLEKIENGFRRTQEFQTKDGRPFSKIEEFVTTADRSKRIVIQQKSSGSTTVLQDILDRQDDGSFRLTRRFTDETGETSTDVQFNITPLDADVLLGREPEIEKAKDKPFQPLRGTEFDLKT